MIGLCTFCDAPTKILYRLPTSIAETSGAVCGMCFIRLTPRSPLRRDRLEIPDQTNPESVYRRGLRVARNRRRPEDDS
jgi:hypothetical protein